MFKRTLFIVLYIIICSVMSFSANAQRMSFKNLTTTMGLSGPNPWAIKKNKDGYIFIGTETGLNKYDGVNFKVYQEIEGDSSSLSGNNIFVIKRDNSGETWIGTTTGLCKYNPENDNFERFYRIINGERELLPKINDITFDSTNTVYVASDEGLYVLDTTTRLMVSKIEGSFRACVLTEKGDIWLGSDRGLINYNTKTEEEIVITDKQGPFKLKENRIFRLFIDSSQKLWISYYKYGIDVVDLNNWTIKYYKKKRNGSNSLIVNGTHVFCELNDKRMALGSGYGLSILNTNTGNFENYFSNDKKNSLASNIITDIYQETNGCIWITCRGGGVSYYDPRMDRIHHYKHEKNNLNSIANNNITSFTEDLNENIWIAIDGGGISRFDVRQGRFTNFPHEKYNPNSIKNNKALAILADKHGDLWVGMWEGGLDRFEIKNDKLILKKRYEYLDYKNSKTNCIFRIYESENGEMYIGTWETGVFKYDRKKDKFIHIPSTEETEINDIFLDKEENLWCARGSLGLIILDKHYQRINLADLGKNAELIDNVNTIFDLHQDKHGNMWIGTGNGLFLLDNHTKNYISFKNSDLPSKAIKGIKEDSKGIIWLSTENGISKVNFNRLKGNKIETKNFGLGDNLQDKFFNRWASFKSKDGTIYFGGANGFNCFNPDSFKYNTIPPPVYLTDFLIDNKSVPVMKNGSVLQKHISRTEQIYLNYNHRYFTFKYIALNFLFSEKNKYAYIMEGFENNWHYVGNALEATYTNLDPGTYTFRVKACNNDGVWNEKGASVKIYILPAWWQTWCFRILLNFIILTMIYTIYRIRVRSIELHRRELENKVKERTQDLKNANKQIAAKATELNKVNKELKDFAYIVSHDLKAPLRGINKLSNWIATDYSDKLDKEGKENLNMLRERASKMNDMIQGILEYSRVGRTELEEEKVDLNNLVEEVIDLLAPPDNIKITIEDKLPEYTANRTRLGELFQNIISNAIKYIDKPKGIIKISYTDEGNEWKFSISDNGPGIEEKNFEKIFKIFQMLDSAPKEGGTGIGLTIVKKIIDLYKGRIWVESEIGKGTTFYFTLPKQKMVL